MPNTMATETAAASSRISRRRVGILIRVLPRRARLGRMLGGRDGPRVVISLARPPRSRPVLWWPDRPGIAQAITRNARRRSRLGCRPQPSRRSSNRTDCAIGRVPTPRVHDDAEHTPQWLCLGRPAPTTAATKPGVHKLLQNGRLVYWIQFPVRAWQSPSALRPCEVFEACPASSGLHAISASPL